MKSFMYGLAAVILLSLCFESFASDSIYKSGWYITIGEDTVTLASEFEPVIRVSYSYKSGSVIRLNRISIEDAANESKIRINSDNIGIRKEGSLFSKEYVVKSTEGRKRFFAAINGPDYVEIDGESKYVRSVGPAMILSTELIKEAI